MSRKRVSDEDRERGLAHMSEETRQWFRRLGGAWTRASEGELPTMQVTPEEERRLDEMAWPIAIFPDGTKMWGGVVLEVTDG